MKISKATIGNVTGGIVGGILLGVGIGMIAYGFNCTHLPQDYGLSCCIITVGGVVALAITAHTTSIQLNRHLGKKWREHFRKRFVRWRTGYEDRKL